LSRLSAKALLSGDDDEKLSFSADFVVGDFRMRAVAVGKVGALLAGAKVGGPCFFGGEGAGAEIRSLVTSIAEGLIGGFAAGAEVVGFAFF